MNAKRDYSIITKEIILILGILIILRVLSQSENSNNIISFVRLSYPLISALIANIIPEVTKPSHLL